MVSSVPIISDRCPNNPFALRSTSMNTCRVSGKGLKTSSISSRRFLNVPRSGFSSNSCTKGTRISMDAGAGSQVTSLMRNPRAFALSMTCAAMGCKATLISSRSPGSRDIFISRPVSTQVVVFPMVAGVSKGRMKSRSKESTCSGASVKAWDS